MSEAARSSRRRPGPRLPDGSAYDAKFQGGQWVADLSIPHVGGFHAEARTLMRAIGICNAQYWRSRRRETPHLFGASNV